jgi:TolB-like protein/thioredoxin-like negative regulator of GroEL
MSLFNELKRRNVIRVGIAYVIAAWLILQFTEVMTELLNLPDTLGPIVVTVVAIGLPLALIFAWAFEMTPEGLKRESEVDRSQSIAPKTGKKLDRAIIAILAIAVVYLLADKLVLQKPSAPASPPVTEQSATETTKPLAEEGPSVAVLPFLNMSDDKSNEYFSDGLTETLLHMLAQLPDLRVAARTSSFAFKGQNKSIGEIATTLGVAHVLEGSVQKSGDRVRVTAQLIRAEDGFHVWSQNYTRPLEDIFAIQDEIATDVAGALDASLLGGDAHMHNVETANLTAYDLYLKAMEQQSIFSYGSLGEAEGLFKQALAEDPEFVDAKLGLVRNLILMNGTGLIDDNNLFKQAEPILNQIRLDQPENRLAEALELTLDTQRQEIFLDPEKRNGTLTRLRNLLPLVPTETYIRQLVAGMLSGFMQQPEEALAVIEAGLIIDPLEPSLHAARGDIYMETDRHEEARDAFIKANELDPRNPNYYGDLSRVSAQLGDLRGKLSYYRKASEVDPEDHELAAFLAEELYQLRLPEEGDRWARKVAVLAPGSDVARRIELLRAEALGDDKNTLEVAISMLEDEVGDRGGAFGSALNMFTELMSKNGRSAEAIDFLQTRQPDLLDFDKTYQRFEPMMKQWSAITLRKNYLPADQVRKDWAAFTTKLDATGIPWRERSETNQAWDLLMQGQADEAAQLLLDKELSKPLASWPERFRHFRGPRWSELAERPAFAARLNELESEYQVARADIQQMLLEPEWSE